MMVRAELGSSEEAGHWGQQRGRLAAGEQTVLS